MDGSVIENHFYTMQPSRIKEELNMSDYLSEDEATMDYNDDLEGNMSERVVYIKWENMEEEVMISDLSDYDEEDETDFNFYEGYDESFQETYKESENELSIRNQTFKDLVIESDFEDREINIVAVDDKDDECLFNRIRELNKEFSGSHPDFHEIRNCENDRTEITEVECNNVEDSIVKIDLNSNKENVIVQIADKCDNDENTVKCNNMLHHKGVLNDRKSIIKQNCTKGGEKIAHATVTDTKLKTAKVVLERLPTSLIIEKAKKIVTDVTESTKSDPGKEMLPVSLIVEKTKKTLTDVAQSTKSDSKKEVIPKEGLPNPLIIEKTKKTVTDVAKTTKSDSKKKIFPKSWRKVKCPKCSKRLRNRESLKKHLQFCGLEANLICRLCPYRTKFKQALNKHLQTHILRSKNTLVDSYGDKINDEKRDYLRLFYRYCEKCNVSVKNHAFKNDQKCPKCKTKYVLHCLKCNKKYETYGNIKYHLNTKCQPVAKIYECSKCYRKLKNCETFKRHLIYCGSVPVFHCDHCPYKTKSKNNLQSHLRIHFDCKDTLIKYKGEIEVPNYIALFKRYCTKCDESVGNYTFRNKLHCQKCNTKFIFQCIECNKKCETYSTIKYHLKIGCYPYMQSYECTKCGRKLKNSETLKRHLMYCGSELMFYCEHCPYKTKIKTYLENHLIFHFTYDDISMKHEFNSKDEKKDMTTSTLHNIKQEIVNKSNMLRYCPKCKESVKAAEVNTIQYCPKCKVKVIFQCLKCNKEYESYTGLTYHIKRQCDPQHTVFQCSTCDYSSSSIQSLEEHLKIVHSTDITVSLIGCPKCGKIMKNIDTLKKHVQYCGTERDLLCKFCPYKTRFKNNLEKHLLLHLKCNDTAGIKENESKEKIKTELITPNGSDTKRIAAVSGKFLGLNSINRYCSKCNESIVDQKFRNDKYCQKCKTKLTYQCVKCNKEYENHTSIIYHLKSTCEPQKYFNCHICEYTTPIKSTFDLHIKKVHATIDPLNFKECTKCGKSFKDVDCLKKHFKYCGKLPNLSCEFCPYKSKFRSSLESHIRRHMSLSVKKAVNEFLDGEKDVKDETIKAELDDTSIKVVKRNREAANLFQRYCSKCNEVNQNCAFRNNMTCEKCKTKFLLQCLACNQNYETYGKLMYHIKAGCGLNSQIYECTKCGRKLKNSETLKRHLKYCGSEPVYYCDLCPYKSKFKQTLVGHLRIHMVEGALMTKFEQLATSPVINRSLIKRYCPQCKDIIDGMKFRNNLHCQKCKTKVIFQCIKCNKEYETYTGIIYHLRHQCESENKHVQYQCSECDYKTSVVYSLQKHVNCVHSLNPSKTRIVCDKCQKVLKNQESYKRHIIYCGIKADLSCHICPYKTRFKQNLKNHILCHQRRNSISMVKRYRNRNQAKIPLGSSERYCTKCDEGMSNCAFKNEKYCDKCKTKLIRRCLKCHQQFDTYGRLRYHIMKGFCNGKPNLNCEQCAFKTQSKRRFTRHLKKHIPKDNISRFIKIDPDKSSPMNLYKALCPKCDKLRVAINRKRKCIKCKTKLVFLCNKCDARLPNRGALRLHVIQHLDDCHKCLGCGKAFAQLENLRMHEKVCNEKSPLPVSNVKAEEQ